MLVGGTSLALQMGHRISIDLDFFTNQVYDADSIFEYLREDFPVSEPFVKDRSTLITEIKNVKVDFIRFRYNFQRPFIRLDGLRLLDIEDIAPMKLDAITGRGKKKDFYDLYFLLQKYSLPQLLMWYSEMFGHNTLLHVWKSLVYFEDAEADGNPIILDNSVTWDQVKTTIRQAVQQL